MVSGRELLQIIACMDAGNWIDFNAKDEALPITTVDRHTEVFIPRSLRYSFRKWMRN
jgi:hypothetical protein